MNICYISPHKWLDVLGEELNKLGHNVSSDTSKETELILGMSVTKMGMIERAHKLLPKVPMINYNWDVYSWVWDRPREGEYDYKRYGELLKQSFDVWVPSEAEMVRTKQWFDLDSQVIKCYVPQYEIKEEQDNGIVVCPLRKLPDEQADWFVKACTELGVPFIWNTNHGFELEEYANLIGGARLLISHYKELSTGGLTLVEALQARTPSLVYSGSTNAATEYLGDLAQTFKDYDELIDKIQEMYHKPERLDEEKAINKYLEYTPEKMAQKVHSRLKELF